VKNNLPAREFLLTRFRYEPETGILYWREKSSNGDVCTQQWNTRHAGKEAGTIKRTKRADHCYRQVSVNKIVYPAHRLIFKMQTGLTPDEVDHLDRDALNNRWFNLRDCSHASNMKNLTLRYNNRSGYTGVVANGKGRFIAQVGHQNKMIKLGLFDTAEQANTAVKLKRAELGYNATHGEAK